MVDLRDKARYQRGISINFMGLNLATRTYVLFILDDCYLSHTPQALRFHYGISSSTGTRLLALPC